MESRREGVRAVAAAVAVQATALAAMVAVVRTGVLGSALHELSDALVYAGYAHEVALGRVPYRDFAFEYPPLALLPILVPPAGSTLARYQEWFSLLVTGLLLGSAGVAAAAVWRARQEPGRVLLAGVVNAVAVAGLGGVVLDRLDAGVALAVALVLWLGAGRKWRAAAVAVGLGVAFKVTPVVWRVPGGSGEGRRSGWWWRRWCRSCPSRSWPPVVWRRWRATTLNARCRSRACSLRPSSPLPPPAACL